MWKNFDRVATVSFQVLVTYRTHSTFRRNVIQLITPGICYNSSRSMLFIQFYFGMNIRAKLLTKDEEGIQQIVPFANQVMIAARSEMQSELMKAIWADTNR